MDELITNVWDYDQIPSDATIRTYIKKIRKYIGEEFISNIKGVGYRFNKI
jgi:DNA-binding response OmpR family regulator